VFKNNITGLHAANKSIAAFIATVVKNPDLWKAENLGIARQINEYTQ
jgi:hypothetical protein